MTALWLTASAAADGHHSPTSHRWHRPGHLPQPDIPRAPSLEMGQASSPEKNFTHMLTLPTQSMKSS